eukprot:scaffold2980_cov236-Pinguiococcus_pyrenoidosus.AAC.2
MLGFDDPSFALWSKKPGQLAIGSSQGALVLYDDVRRKKVGEVRVHSPQAARNCSWRLSTRDVGAGGSQESGQHHLRGVEQRSRACARERRRHADDLGRQRAAPGAAAPSAPTRRDPLRAVPLQPKPVPLG